MSYTDNPVYDMEQYMARTEGMPYAPAICSCCGQAVDVDDPDCLVFFRKKFHRSCIDENAPLFIDEYIAKFQTEFHDWCKMWGANPNDPTDRLDFGDCDSDFPEYVAERVILW